MICKLCLEHSTDSFFGNYCVSCHRLSRMIALFSIEKVMSVLDTVLLVDSATQKDKIKTLLKCELSTRVESLIDKKQKKFDKIEEETT